MSFDFRVEADFFGHPKTDALRAALGDTGIVCLLRLWAYAAEYRPDGDLSGLSDEMIEEKAGWRGAPADLILSLTSSHARWLDGQKLRRHLHDWRTHQPWLAGRPARKAAAKEAARIRWENKHAERIAPGNASSSADSMRRALPPNTLTPQQAPAGPNTPASQNTPLPPTGVFVTTQEAKDECAARGWDWPTELKPKSKTAIEAVYPCDREVFDAAVRETEKRNPVNAAAYLAGTIRSMKLGDNGKKHNPAVGWSPGSETFQNGEVKL